MANELVNQMATEPLVPYGNHEEEIFVEDCKEYYLFLLEFFVKRVSGNRLAKLNQMFFVPTSVHFSFLDFVDENELQVTPVDPLFQPQAGIATEVEIFNSGKSVLFAVDHDSATDRNAKLILTINVKKRMPDGIKPDVLVGSCELDLSSEYAALRLETLQCWQKGVTITKTFDDQLELLHNDNVSGCIEMYARISSFGQTIVTEFDTPRNTTSFIFGAGEMDQGLLYQCDKLTVDSIDLLKSSSDDLENSGICSVCSPKAQICMPCKRRGAVQKRETRPICNSKKSVEKIAWKKSMDAMCTVWKKERLVDYIVWAQIWFSVVEDSDPNSQINWVWLQPVREASGSQGIRSLRMRRRKEAYCDSLR